MSDNLVETVQEHGSALYRIAWRILGHTDDADDVLQDALLEAIEVSKREKVASWIGLLKRLSVLRSLDRLRKRRPEVSMDQLEVASANDSPVDQTINRELRIRLRQTLGQLPPRQAEVFCLRYFDDLSNQQIAATLVISAAAVATALRQARTRLSELMSDELCERSSS